MLEADRFAFDLEGPLDLYACGHCGKQDIEPYGATYIRCRNCVEITTPEGWCVWCSDHGIDLALGPFLQAVKNVKELRHPGSFDLSKSRARYVGPAKAHVRATTLKRSRQLKAEYMKLCDPKFRVIGVEEL